MKFESLESKGFLFKDSHSYALPGAVDDHIRAGRTVVANVSRKVIEAMRRAYAGVTVVSITAPRNILVARLAARERGSDGPVAGRLNRAVHDAAPDITITNVGSAEEHARQLLRAIRGV